VAGMVLQVQMAALDRLMQAGTAQRLLDLPMLVQAETLKGAAGISLHEVYGSLQDAIWSELKTGREIDRLRRNLQREHLKRVQALLLRGGAGLPADALSLVRWHAVQLQQGLARAAGRSAGLSAESRAHLQDSLAQLKAALQASMLRA
jgi:hypothetical protein